MLSELLYELVVEVDEWVTATRDVLRPLALEALRADARASAPGSGRAGLDIASGQSDDQTGAAR